MTKRAYTTGEAARICGLSLSTLKRWIKRGALRVYRTPGGDIRIPRDQLRDFMREFEIPLFNLEGETRVLLDVRDDNLRRMVLRVLNEHFGDCECEIVEGDVRLGFQLGHFQPDAVVLDGGKTTLDTLERCTQIRSLVAPKAVRIGVIGERVLREIDERRPDVVLDPGAARAGVVDFLEGLLANLVAESTAPPQRRHSA